MNFVSPRAQSSSAQSQDVQSWSLQLSIVQGSRVQACSCPESKRSEPERPESSCPEPERPVAQSLRVQSASAQSSWVQGSRVQSSSRPESKCPGHTSRVQLFRYATVFCSLILRMPSWWKHIGRIHGKKGIKNINGKQNIGRIDASDTLLKECYTTLWYKHILILHTVLGIQTCRCYWQIKCKQIA